jgi:type I restriction enzyme S subunit
VFGIRANKAKVYPKYLNAYMHSAFFRQELNRRATGTTVLGIRQTELLKTAVILPLMSEQIQIGDLYSHISDKIGLNAQLNQTLEDMARAIFKSWFVDFDPVRAKVAGKPTGLPKEISDLFPSRLVHSDLGEIPEGWREKHLSEIASSIRGKSYTSNDLQEAENALVTLKSFSRGGGYRADGLKSYSGGYKPEQVVSPGEIVVSCTDVTQNAEVIGRPAIVRTDKRYKLLIASQDLMIVRPKLSAVGVGYLYCLLRTDAFTNHTYAHSTGTTVLHLFKEAVPTFTFCCPTEPIIKVFSSIADSIYKKIDLLGLETENLTLIRDTLLPKLMSGEIRVNQ